MILSRFRLSLAALLLLATSLQADILVLKNGERKEGTILNETPESIRMRYRLTPKIFDEKDFPRSEVAEVIRQRPEEIAIEEQGLRKVLPTKDMMMADEYERLIQDRLRPFINQFPGTPEAEEVEGIIAEIQAEKQKVVSGQLKVDGQWLSAEEVKRDDYNIDAYRARQSIEELADTQDVAQMIEALKEFERFSDSAGGYLASTHFPAVVPTVIDLLNNYETFLLRMISEQPILAKNREDNMKSLVEPDLSRTKAAIQQQVDAWQAVYDAEKRARVTWLTPYKYDLKSLEEAHKSVVTERAKLQALDLPKLEEQNALLVNVYRFLEDENATEAEAALLQATNLIGSSSGTYGRILGELRNRVSKMKSELMRQKAAQRTFNSTSGAIAGNTDAIVDDRVAAAMAEAEKPITSEEPAEASPAEEPAAPEPAAPAPAPAPAAAPAAPAPAAAASSGGFPMTFVIGAVVLLVVLLGAMAMQKKKQG